MINSKCIYLHNLCFRSHVLQKVCMYFTYKVRYTNSSTEIPEFPIAPEIALELLMAANFLDCWTRVNIYYICFVWSHSFVGAKISSYLHEVIIIFRSPILRSMRREKKNMALSIYNYVWVLQENKCEVMSTLLDYIVYSRIKNC